MLQLPLQLGLHPDHIQELTRALPDHVQYWYLDLEGMLRGREGRVEMGRDWRDGEKKEGRWRDGK